MNTRPSRRTSERSNDRLSRTAAAIEHWWQPRSELLLGLATALLAVIASLKLSTEFYRLTVETGFSGAIDLRLRWHEVRSWFAGVPFYEQVRRISYPPQAYALFWLFLGWLSLPAARWLWAAATVLVLGGLVWVLLRASEARSGRERAFVVACILSMNAVGVSVGNGQVTLHLMLALLAGLALLRDPRVTVARDGWAGVLLAASLAKFTLTAPFAWVVILWARRVRPLLFIVAAYVIMTLVAAAYQPHGPLELLRHWAALNRTRLGRGYGNVATALAGLGLGELAPLVGIALVLLLGLWIVRHRDLDAWILLGVSALIARFWTYHLVYDDALILLPMITLFRITKRTASDPRERVLAGVLLAIAVLAMLAPARMEISRPPLNWLFIGGHVLVWLAMFGFLVRIGRRSAAG